MNEFVVIKIWILDIAVEFSIRRPVRAPRDLDREVTAICEQTDNPQNIL